MNLDKDLMLLKVKKMIEAESKEYYKTYFESLEIESINDNKIILIAHSEKQKDNLEKRFYDLLQNCFKILTNKTYEIEIIVKAEYNREKLTGLLKKA